MTDYKELNFYFGDNPTIPLFYLSSDDLELRAKAIEDLWRICEHQNTIAPNTKKNLLDFINGKPMKYECQSIFPF